MGDTIAQTMASLWADPDPTIDDIIEWLTAAAEQVAERWADLSGSVAAMPPAAEMRHATDDEQAAWIAAGSTAAGLQAAGISLTAIAADIEHRRR